MKGSNMLLENIKETLLVMQLVLPRKDLVTGLMEHIEYLGCYWYSKNVQGQPFIREACTDFNRSITYSGLFPHLKIYMEYNPSSSTAGVHLHIRTFATFDVIEFKHLSNAELEEKYKKWIEAEGHVVPPDHLKLPTTITEAKNMITIATNFLQQWEPDSQA